MVTAPPPRARSGVFYRCTACEATSLRWVGRCPSCGAWNTFGRRRRPPGSARPGMAAAAAGAVALADVSTEATQPLPTGVSELDRVLGGGVVGGSVTLLFGPPGIGKSTLLFQVLSSVAAAGSRRHARLGRGVADPGAAGGRRASVWCPGTSSRWRGPTSRRSRRPSSATARRCVVVDSLQSVSDPELAQPAGSLAQVRACVERLTRMAKSSGVPARSWWAT